MRCPSCGQENPEGMTFCGRCAVKMDSPADEARPHDVVTSSDFVGRQREMRELVSALDDALAGKGRLIMLVGDPGIGKTRTAQELATIAEQQGAQVLWGRCYEGEGAPPYWPWMQPIRAYVQQKDAEQLRSEMGPNAADIAEIVPEVKDKLPDLEPPPSLDSPESARFRLFDSITTFLKRACENQPLMLVLDNLHWADRSSLLLLEFLTQEIGSSRLLVLGTYRDVEVSRRDPLSQTLGNLVREQSFLRVQLRGLSQQEVGQFVQTITGETPDPALAQAVHSRTEGNPLFVGEVVRLLAQEGIEGNQTPDIRIPEGVRDAIGRRLNLLSEECNRVLTTASVVGRGFSLELLLRLIDDFPQSKLLDILEEGLTAKVIEELPPVVGRYQFTHALIQSTLVDELSLTRRVQLHARIAETMEELYGEDVETHATELAHHFAEAQTLLGVERLVKYSKMAGEQALAAYAYEEAVSHFERALSAKEGLPMDAETAAILFGLGRAQFATGQRNQFKDATATLTRAFDYYEKVGDKTRAIEVASNVPDAFTGMDTGAGQLLERALKLVPDDSIEAAHLLSRYGTHLTQGMGDYEGGQDAFNRALLIARREGNKVLEMRTLVSGAYADYFYGYLKEGLEKGLQATELIRELDQIEPAWAYGHLWTSYAMLGLGDVKGARSHAEASLEYAEQLRNRNLLTLALLSNTQLAYRDGRWDVYREFSDRGLSVSSQHPLSLGSRAVVEHQLGNFRQGELYLERLLEVMRSTAPGPSIEYTLPAWVIPWAARITGVGDRLDVAEEAAKIVLSSPNAIPFVTLTARSGMALIAIHRGDTDAVAREYPALVDVAGTMVGAFIQGDQLLGLLAQTMGKLDDAQTHFEDALAFCRKAGYRLELAWSLCDYAETLLQRNASGDHARATSLLDESLAISTELGMRPLIERVNALKDRAESPSAKAPVYPDGLTQREVEVLRLVAAGKTDREIADELIISIRTVGNHVSNILNRANVANRTEAASYATRHGLT